MEQMKIGLELHTSVSLMISSLCEVLCRLDDVQYASSLSLLSGASVGEHTRHLAEMFTCLQNGYPCGTVSYEKRKREPSWQQSATLMTKVLREIGDTLYLDDKPMILSASYSYESDIAGGHYSSYYRELAYCLDHAIHHMALIKIGLKEVGYIDIPETFGLAPSTHRERRRINISGD